MPKLSVIIPTYNRSFLVKQAIDSALSQVTDAEIEVIVVDDGSIDDTCQSLQRYGPRIRYFYQSNRGMNAARNLGIEKSTGDYVSLLDSDDVWLPFKASLQIRLMEYINDVGFSFSNFYIWRNGDRIPDGLGSWMSLGRGIAPYSSTRIASSQLGMPRELKPFTVSICDVYALSLYQPVVLPSTSIVRREVLDSMGPFPEDNWMCGDWEYFAKASRRFGAAYVDIETALNRSHDDPVRLMRRNLIDRTTQRLESIQRTWKTDADFMAKFSMEVFRVESDQWAILFKHACYANDLSEAKRCLETIDSLTGFVPLKFRLLLALIHIPGSAQVVDAIRRIAHHSVFPLLNRPRRR